MTNCKDHDQNLHPFWKC